MTHTPRNLLIFHDLANRFGVNEKLLPFSIRLGIVWPINYLIPKE